MCLLVDCTSNAISVGTDTRTGDTGVFALGSPVDCDLEALRRQLGRPEMVIGVDLGIGSGFARVWGCDLTEGYRKEDVYYTM